MNWYNNDFNPYPGSGPYGYNPYNDPRHNGNNGRYYHNNVPTLYSSAHHAPSSFEEYRHSFQQNLEETRRSFQQNMEECRRTFQENMEEYRRDFYERHSAVGDDNYAQLGDDNYDAMPWEQEGWVPLTKSGKQKSPSQIRNELQRYIDQCKVDGTSNQTRIIEQMGVNSNSFRKFMDPSTYRNQWNAIQNGTYWAAAKLLAKVAYEKELAKATSGSGSKRKTTRDDEYYDSDDYDDEDAQAATKRYKSNSGEIKKTRAEVQLEALTLIRNIKSVNVRDDGIVYDTCPEIVQKIKAFLTRDGMTKSNLLLALGGLNSNSLNTFLAGKRQDQAGNKTYRLAYVFFEQLRIYEGMPKSSVRIGNEIEHPYGFPLEKPRLVVLFHSRCVFFNGI